jgi:hypothetical protein
VKLNLDNHLISDENWTILCKSLQGHTTLTSLDLDDTGHLLSAEQTTQRTNLLAEMLQSNRVLHRISLNEYDDKIYAESILPHLETNFYIPRVLAIKKADIALRRPLLGLALQTKSVRSKSNLLWMFLSGNVDVVLQSNEDSEQVLEIAASAPVEVAASAQEEGEVTRKRKL